MSGTEAPTYVVEDPRGGFWYHVPAASSHLHADVRMDSPAGHALIAGPKRGWFWSAEEVARLFITPHERQETTGWALKDGIQPTEDRPGTLTPGEAAGWDGGSLSTLYDRQTRTVTPDPIEVDVPMLKLVGEPWPADAAPGLRWSGTLPTELRERAEYVHLFPGYLTGITDALKDELSKLPGVTAYNHDSWKVFVTAVRPKKVGWKSDRTTKQIDAKAPPYRIDAANRAEALAKYAALRDEWVARVQAVKVCSCCAGTGWAP